MVLMQASIGLCIALGIVAHHHYIGGSTRRLRSINLEAKDGNDLPQLCYIIFQVILTLNVIISSPWTWFRLKNKSEPDRVCFSDLLCQ